MSTLKKNLKVCSNGHQFYKSSSCPVCPICSRETKPATGFLSNLSAPARRALEAKGITTLKKLSGFTEKALLELHGIGKTSIPILRNALKEEGLSLKETAVDTFTTKPSETAKVNAFMKNLQHPLGKVVEVLRQIILSVDKEIGEEIYWNAPTFFYTGSMKPFNPKEYKRFIAVLNFYKKDCIRMIFLTGAKLNDESGLLEGDYTDGRRLAHFYDLKDVKAKEKTLRSLVKKWLKLLDK